jgi:hypothetical protein
MPTGVLAYQPGHAMIRKAERPVMIPPQPDETASPNGHTWLSNQAPSHTPNPKRVFLHIGFEKTGSSAIQAFCSRNREWLNNHDIEYPKIGSLPQHVSIHFDLASKNPRRIHTLTQKLRRIIDDSPHQNIIFSHESLHLHNPQVFRSIFAGYDTRIIAYLRNPTQASISHFATMVRFGRLPIHDLYRALRQYSKTMLPVFDYYWSLKAYASAFGHENIITRHYDPDSLVSNQSTTDFLHLFDINDLRKSSWPYARANPSLDADQFELVARLARLLKDRPRKTILKTTQRICNEFAKESSPDTDRPFELLVPERLKQKITRYFEPTLPLLYRDFFEHKPIFEPTPTHSSPAPEVSTKRLKELHRVLIKSKIVAPDLLDQLKPEPCPPLDAINA